MTLQHCHLSAVQSPTADGWHGLDTFRALSAAPTPGPPLSALGSSGWECHVQVKEGLIPARLGGQNGLLGDSGPEG